MLDPKGSSWYRGEYRLYFELLAESGKCGSPHGKCYPPFHAICNTDAHPPHQRNSSWSQTTYTGKWEVLDCLVGRRSAVNSSPGTLTRDRLPSPLSTILAANSTSNGQHPKHGDHYACNTTNAFREINSFESMRMNSPCVSKEDGNLHRKLEK